MSAAVSTTKGSSGPSSVTTSTVSRRGLRKTLNDALAIAKNAVQLDSAGDYARSIEAYQQSVDLLDHGIALIKLQSDVGGERPGRDITHEISQLEQICEKYRSRIHSKGLLLKAKESDEQEILAAEIASTQGENTEKARAQKVVDRRLALIAVKLDPQKDEDKLDEKRIRHAVENILEETSTNWQIDVPLNSNGEIQKILSEIQNLLEANGSLSDSPPYPGIQLGLAELQDELIFLKSRESGSAPFVQEIAAKIKQDGANGALEAADYIHNRFLSAGRFIQYRILVLLDGLLAQCGSEMHHALIQNGFLFTLAAIRDALPKRVLRVHIDRWRAVMTPPLIPLLDELGQFKRTTVSPLCPFMTSAGIRAVRVLEASRGTRILHMQAIHLAHQALHLVDLLNNSIEVTAGPTRSQNDEKILLESELRYLERTMKSLHSLPLSSDSEYMRLEMEVSQEYDKFFRRRPYFDPGTADLNGTISLEWLRKYDRKVAGLANGQAIPNILDQRKSNLLLKQRSRSGNSLTGLKAQRGWDGSEDETLLSHINQRGESSANMDGNQPVSRSTAVTEKTVQTMIKNFLVSRLIIKAYDIKSPNKEAVSLDCSSQCTVEELSDYIYDELYWDGLSVHILIPDLWIIRGHTKSNAITGVNQHLGYLDPECKLCDVLVDGEVDYGELMLKFVMMKGDYILAVVCENGIETFEAIGISKYGPPASRHLAGRWSRKISKILSLKDGSEVSSTPFNREYFVPRTVCLYIELETTPIRTLPVEILLDIIRYLIPHVPVIGQDNSWKNPSDTSLWWRIGLEKKVSDQLLQSSEQVSAQPPKAQGQVPSQAPELAAYYEPLKTLDQGSAQLPEAQDQAASYAPEPVAEALKVHNPYMELLTLRQVNRLFNAVCTPALYHELHLVPTDKLIDVKDHPVLSRYAHHVRIIRVWVDRSIYREEHEKLSLKALEMCEGVRSIALYYMGRSNGVDAIQQINYATNIVGGLQRKSINAIGIYDELLFRFSHSQAGVGPGLETLLEEVLSTQKIALSLDVLEVSVSVLRPGTYDCLRSNLTNIKSLSMRRCIEGNLGRIWDIHQRSKWAVYQHLTHLQLIDCEGAYSAHIPEIVRHFSSLQYLLVYACGSFRDVPYNYDRYKGWSSEDDALCQVHEPLKEMRVDHMLDWEILAMGTIAATTLIITNVVSSHVPSVFNQDPEIFPGLKTLWLDPPDPNAPEVELQSDKSAEQEAASQEDDESKRPRATLEDICRARGIELRRDAEWLINSQRPRPGYMGP